MIANSQPLPGIDQAQLIAEIQQAANDLARKMKAIGPTIASSSTANAALRLSDRFRRDALFAETLVIDLHNEARRNDLENGAPLPDDPNTSQGSTMLAGLPASTNGNAALSMTTAPLFLQDQATQPT